MNVCQKDHCTGCNACINICPKKCITLSEKKFKFNAIIDETLCIHCKQCENVCQVINKDKLNFMSPLWCLEGWTQDSILRSKSSSGGIASQLMKEFIAFGGFVCSCLYTENDFTFKISNQLDDISRFSGSKYVKSNTKVIFVDLKKHLDNGQKILFIGLPCQVAGLKMYLQKDYPSLFTVDLICHGTPSIQFLNQFLLEKKYELKDIKQMDFRNKHNFQLYINQKTVSCVKTQDAYTMGFLNSLNYTENCYHCAFAKSDRISDLTIGDSWGNKDSKSEQKKGISLILIQTQKGKELFEKCNFYSKECDLNIAISTNHQLEYPSRKPKNRNAFIKSVETDHQTIEEATKKYCFKKYFKQQIKKALIKLGIISKEM